MLEPMSVEAAIENLRTLNTEPQFQNAVDALIAQAPKQSELAEARSILLAGLDDNPTTNRVVQLSVALAQLEPQPIEREHTIGVLIHRIELESYGGDVAYLSYGLGKLDLSDRQQEHLWHVVVTRLRHENDLECIYALTEVLEGLNGSAEQLREVREVLLKRVETATNSGAAAHMGTILRGFEPLDTERLHTIELLLERLATETDFGTAAAIGEHIAALGPEPHQSTHARLILERGLATALPEHVVRLRKVLTRLERCIRVDFYRLTTDPSHARASLRNLGWPDENDPLSHLATDYGTPEGIDYLLSRKGAYEWTLPSGHLQIWRERSDWIWLGLNQDVLNGAKKKHLAVGVSEFYSILADFKAFMLSDREREVRQY